MEHIIKQVLWKMLQETEIPPGQIQAIWNMIQTCFSSDSEKLPDEMKEEGQGGPEGEWIRELDGEPLNHYNGNNGSVNQKE